MRRRSRPAVQKAMEAKYGLDKPLGAVSDLSEGRVHLRFGPSLKQRGRMVIDIIADGLKTSASSASDRRGFLPSSSALCSALRGAAQKYGARPDHHGHDDGLRIHAVLYYGIAAAVAFAIKLHVFPANGSTAAGLILPVITLMLYPMSYITRLTRSSMLDVLGQDYIRTAKAKGVSRMKIIFSHALKNALIPVITYFGPMLAYIVTGSLVVEQIFAVPGIGRAFVSSITNRDYTMIMGTTIILAA